MENTTTTIKYPKRIRLFLQFVGLVIQIVGMIVLYSAFQLEELPLLQLLVGVLVLVFGILCFSDSFRTVTISARGISEKNLFRTKQIHRDEIKGYTQVVHKHSRGDIIQLVIFTQQGKLLKFQARNWRSNYPLLLKQVGIHYKQLGEKYAEQVVDQRKNFYKNIGIGIGLFILLLGAFPSILNYYFKADPYQNLEGIITEQFTEQRMAKEPIECVCYKLDTYPKYRFCTDPALANETFFREQIRVGEPLSFKILQYEFGFIKKGALIKTYVEKNENGSSILESSTTDIVSIYEIASKEKVLFGKAAGEGSQPSPKPLIWVLLLGITIVVYYRYFSRGYD